MYQALTEILSGFTPVSLQQMDGVKLMNRIDTKFIINLNRLSGLLEAARQHYSILQIDNERITPYSTVYFDTQDLVMYTMHHNGKKNRYKVRMRVYENSGQSFLEVKHKNNKGRTNKKRMEINRTQFLDMSFRDDNLPFMQKRVPYPADELKPVLQNSFNRITLVDRHMTERITIDLGLSFKNVETETSAPVNNLVIIEVKQDGAVKSAFRSLLDQMHVLPGSMSKYCLGMVLVKPGIKTNRFKTKIRKINKITSEHHATN